MVSSLIFVFGAILASSIPATEGFLNWTQRLSGLKSLPVGPICEYSNRTATCCCQVLDKLTQNKLCTTLKVNLNELNLKASLSYNNVTLIERKAEVGKLCVPVGNTPVLACLQIYWVEVGLGDSAQDFKSNVCFQGSVSKIATVDFQCLRYEDGRFTKNSDHKPSNKGLLNFDLGK